MGLALLLSACGGRTTPVDRANAEKILLIGNGAEPKDLDPQITTGAGEAVIHQALFEGLVTLDPATLDPIPGVAEAWTLSEDGRTYTFHLRPDARWSNGDPVTADDFAFAYQRMLSPRLGAEYAYNLYYLKNARAYHRGDTDDFSTVGVSAPDPHTLVLELDNPTPFFLTLLNHPSWFPVHAPTVLAHGAIDQIGNRWTRAGSHVGNGPFRLKRWNVNEVVEVERNPYYWDAETVRLNGIRFYPIVDQNTEERAFRAGQLHMTYTLPLSKLPAYERSGSPMLRLDPDLGTYYFLFNTTRGALADPKVRRALSLAIDREAISHGIRQRGEEAATHFTPPDIHGYTPPSLHHYDPEKARRLLAEAGYPGGQGFPVFELLYNTSEAHRPIAEAVQAMWRKELGIDLRLRNQEWRVFLDSRSRSEFDILRGGWLGDYYDPNTFLDLFTSDSTNNNSGWTHPDYDRLIAEAARTSDEEKRQALFFEAETLLLEDAVIAPVFFYNRAYLMRPEVEGWPPNALNHRLFKQVGLGD
jgi:oligopeptide transport system substrate-binding protein